MVVGTIGGWQDAPAVTTGSTSEHAVRGAKLLQRPPTAVLAAWLLLTLLAGARIDQGVFSDPGWGLLAAEQWRLGLSPGLRTLVQADATDLARDSAGVVSWWPPSYQAVPALFERLGANGWGAAVRASVILCWVSALLGWSACFRLARPRAVHWGWVVLVFATARYTHSAFDRYDGEVLLLGALPWVLVFDIRALAATRSRSLLAFAGGALGASLFAVKYSALLSCAALGFAWLPWSGERARLHAWRPALSYAVGAGAVLAVLHALGVPGGATPSAIRADGVAPLLALYPYTALPLALTELDSLVQFLFVHPTRPWLPEFQRWMIGLPLLLGIAACLGWSWQHTAGHAERGPTKAAALRCATALVCVLPGLLGLLLMAGADLGDRARHVRPAALVALPWIVDALASAAQSAVRRVRLTALLTSGWLVVLPCAYGASTLLEKAFRRSTTTERQVGSSGLRLEVLGGAVDARAFSRALLAARPAADTVVYVTSPDVAIDLASARLLVRHADLTAAAELAKERYHGCPRGGVLLALPSAFEQGDKARLIRASFRDVADWQPLELAGHADVRAYRGACAQPRAHALPLRSRAQGPTLVALRSLRNDALPTAASGPNNR
jgi:hypothetical protein